MSESLRTVPQVFRDTVARHGDRPALRVKRSGAWATLTWKEYAAQVGRAGRAFMKLDVPTGKGVAILGYNSPEWLIADLGAIAAGAVPAGIYTTSSPDQCQYIAHHCEAAVVVSENADQTKKIIEVKGKLPHLKKIVQVQGTFDDPLVISWESFLAMGDSVPEADLDARTSAQSPDDVCTLIYTSGTTGDPKAVMITHANFTWTAEVLVKALGLGLVEERGVSYLPLSHVAEQILTIHGPMQMSSVVVFAESVEKLPEALREVRPTIFLGVPRVWEKMQAKIAAAGSASPPLKKKIAAWARKQGLAGGYAEQRGEKKPLLYGLAKKVVFSKVREKIGLDCARVCVTSAAPISKDTLEFFLSLGIPILEVYGMSECTGPATYSPSADLTPASRGPLTRYRTGKAGIALPGTELKIASDGEVCMRGKHVFKGYLKDQAATAAALDADGWLHSGDIGEIDQDGFLQITDRKKDLLITAGGENIAPQVIEGQLKAIPAVAQAVVLGDRQKYLAALVTLDPDRVVAEAQAAGSPARDVAHAAKCDVFRAHLEKQIEALNHKLARVQTIKKFAIIPGEFTVDGGELTPTMKVKRKVVNEKYKAEIALLYAEG